MSKSKNCQTARGNVRRGLWGDGRRSSEEESCENYENSLWGNNYDE